MLRTAKDGREECPYCGAALYSASELQKHQMSCTLLLENTEGIETGDENEAGSPVEEGHPVELAPARSRRPS
ncbi:MAG: hypothetical protein ACE15D_02080 [Candidatus Eisenbacteria bacterium]|nr:hypothetical protein [Candidatus Eisenbacteria bacterium]